MTAPPWPLDVAAVSSAGILRHRRFPSRSVSRKKRKERERGVAFLGRAEMLKLDHPFKRRRFSGALHSIYSNQV